MCRPRKHAGCSVLEQGLCSWQHVLQSLMPDRWAGVDAQVVLAGTRPPPSIASRSCVYVIKRSDGMLYCGQSDNLTSERSACSGHPAWKHCWQPPVQARPPSACVPVLGCVTHTNPSRAADR